MQTKKIILGITAIISLLLLAVIIHLRVSTPVVEEALTITNFESCKNAGYQITGSSTAECHTPDGTLFTREVQIPVTETTTLPSKKNPDSIPVVAPNILTFNTPITYKVGDTKTYTDGLTVTLKEIKDSRCKEGVQCIWAGELSPFFSATGGAVGATTSSVEFATTYHSHPVILPHYMFTMIGTTDLDTTISVWKSTTTLNEYGATSLPVPPEARSCKIDSDCVRFSAECTVEEGYGCEYVEINKAFKGELKSQKAGFCALNPSPIDSGCDIEWDPDASMKCIHKVCQFN